MSKTNTNTTKSIKEPANINSEIEKSLAKAKKAFQDEKLVDVSVPKSFQTAIGNTLFLAINGVQIVLPVDGTRHKVPETFARHLSDYLNNY